MCVPFLKRSSSRALVLDELAGVFAPCAALADIGLAFIKLYIRDQALFDSSIANTVSSCV